MIEQLNKIIKDPVGYVSQCGLNVPQNINTPDGIIQYLLNTGQISQQKYNQAMSLARRFM
jgi:hypothetical protein